MRPRKKPNRFTLQLEVRLTEEELALLDQDAHHMNHVSPKLEGSWTREDSASALLVLAIRQRLQELQPKHESE